MSISNEISISWDYYVIIIVVYFTPVRAYSQRIALVLVLMLFYYHLNAYTDAELFSLSIPTSCTSVPDKRSSTQIPFTPIGVAFCEITVSTPHRHF